jgi:hypothetical protein
MNEPEHPHFVLSDAMYVHVLPEGLIVAKKDLPKVMPVQKDGPETMTLALLGAAVFVTLFFAVMTAITGMYLITFLMAAMLFLAVQNLLRSLKFSATDFIPRSAIKGVEYRKKSFGFDSLIVTYSGKNGKVFMRRFAIYDSHDCLVQALQVMKTEGWL